MSAFVAVCANLVGGGAVYVTIGLMSSVTEFAAAARENSLLYLPEWRVVSYCAVLTFSVAYAWPLIRYFQDGCPQEPSRPVRRRAVSLPLMLSAAGFAGWVLSPLFFASITLWRFGRWSTELMSQQILSPWVDGYLAATITYLLVDWIFRVRVLPHVFPEGRLAEVPGTFSAGVRGRLFIFLTAVAFVPLFTFFGLIRAALARYEAGLDAGWLLVQLNQAGVVMFFAFLVLGALLTMILGRSLTVPLAASAAALRRVQRGELEVSVAVESADEVGLLADGINEMVAALRDRERILHTFGQVVEPSVRDHLLSGRYERGGELRTATIMFCDLRGFTAMSEELPPHEVVATLNEFFTVMAGWVRECGGFVDKFIGDALLVVFGLFDADWENPAAAGAEPAVRCALGMRDRLAELNRTRRERGAAELAVSTGIHTGELLVGTIGSADRHEYTVIGDTVNVAARLQEVSKAHDGALVLSQATYEHARDAGLEVEVGESESIHLRGRREPVRAYTLE